MQKSIKAHATIWIGIAVLTFCVVIGFSLLWTLGILPNSHVCDKINTQDVNRDHSHVVEFLNIEEIKHENRTIRHFKFTENEYKYVNDIQGKITNIRIRNADDALDAVWSIKNILGIKNPYEELVLTSTNNFSGTTTYTFNQVYNGYKVAGATLKYIVPNKLSDTDKYHVISTLYHTDFIKTIPYDAELMPRDIVKKASDYYKTKEVEVKELVWLFTEKGGHLEDDDIIQGWRKDEYCYRPGWYKKEQEFVLVYEVECKNNGLAVYINANTGEIEGTKH